MKSKIDIWHVTFAAALIIALSLWLGESYNTHIETDKLRADIERGQQTIDSLDRQIVKNQIILDSLKLTFIKDTARINDISKYYENKINSIDSLSIDSIRKLLAGHSVHN